MKKLVIEGMDKILSELKAIKIKIATIGVVLVIIGLYILLNY